MVHQFIGLYTHRQDMIVNPLVQYIISVGVVGIMGIDIIRQVHPIVHNPLLNQFRYIRSMRVYTLRAPVGIRLGKDGEAILPVLRRKRIRGTVARGISKAVAHISL